MAMFICPFLPWLSNSFESKSLSELSKSGSESVLAELIVISLLGALGAILRLSNKINYLVARIWAGAIGALGLIEFFNINGQIDENFSGDSR